MRLAIKAYRAPFLLITFSILGIIGLLMSNVALSFPSVTGEARVPIGIILGLIACAITASAALGGWPEPQTVTVRPAGGILAVILGALTCISLGSVALIGSVGWNAGTLFAGTTAWLLAIQLVVGIFASSKYQAMGPAVYVLLCALVGRVDGQVQPWAWPLAELDGILALAIGGVCLLSSLILLSFLGLHRQN